MSRDGWHGARARWRGLRGEGGVALPMALIVLVVLAALAAAVLAVGTSEINIATNHARTAQALALAEAGLESAFTLINTSLSGTSLIGSATDSFTNLAVTQPAAGSTLASYGTYGVKYKSIGTNTVEVVSTGTTANGTARRVLRAIMTSNLNSVTAVLSKKDITVSGNTTVDGACGSVHSNEDLGIAGTGNVIAVNATASVDYSASGSPKIGGVSGGGRPTKVVPDIDPAKFLAQADDAVKDDATGETVVYELLSDGHVWKRTRVSETETEREQLTEADAPLGNGDTWEGWKFRTSGSTSWTAEDASLIPGAPEGPAPSEKALYYIGADGAIGTSIGTSGSRWVTTIITTGDFELKAGTSSYLDAALNDMIFAVGGNLKTSGNQNIDSGVIGVAGTVDLGGTVEIVGAIIAEGETKLAGTVNITYACGLNSGIETSLSTIAWGY